MAEMTGAIETRHEAAEDRRPASPFGAIPRMVAIAVMLAVIPAPGAAQWLDYPTPGTPRLADGTPDLLAPAPRNTDQTPDLSGIWQATNDLKYLLDLAADLDAGAPLQPWAAAVYAQRQANGSRNVPTATCNFPGVPHVDTIPAPYKILQMPGLVVVLHEALNIWRQIFTDGRDFPEDPVPTWMGYSVGRWEADALVVETRGFNGRVWLDLGGLPTTESLRVVERFRRRDFGHIDLEITIDDPGAYTEPWRVSYELGLLPDTELLENNCNENNLYRSEP